MTEVQNAKGRRCSIIEFFESHHRSVCLVVFLSVVSVLVYSYWWMGGSSSSGMSSRPVEVAATERHTATVIFLHGLGDTGHGWCDALKGISQPHIKYVCPTAPSMPVTLNAGMRMPSWFDIKGLNPNSQEDVEGIQKSSALLQQLISDEEKSGIPRNRIVVGGFSQGGAVSLYSALTSPKTSSLAGIIALSTWLPLHKQLPQEVKSNTDTPILQCHGTSDPIVPYQWGQMTGYVLGKLCSKHEMKSYPGVSHSSCDQEMKDVKAFIDKCLPAV